MSLINQSQVIVIGAGFAGLSAALKLKKSGIDTILLESRDRTGGRVKTTFLPDGTQIDLGGQWIGPTQKNMYRLAKKYKIGIFPSQSFGKDISLYNGEILEEDPPEVDELFDKLDALALTVNQQRPWLTPNAEQLDGETFKTWLDREAQTPEAAEYVARSLSGGLLAVNSAEFSTLQMITYIASGNGLDYLNGVDGGAQQDRIYGGLQYITIKMADDFGKDKIYFNQPVKQIKYNENGVDVITPTECFHAEKVIIAIPPAVMESVEFVPELPVLKKKMFEHMMPPAAFKAHFIYNTPFWREQGFSGTATCGSGYLSETYDNTLVDPKVGVLTIFSYGDEANDLRAMTEKKRKDVIINELVYLYGQEAKNIIGYVEYDWSKEKYTNGCFSSHFGPNAWVSLGIELNKPVGPLYWASSEMAIKWNGYADGAVESGNNAAKKVLTQLQAEQK